MKRQSVVGLILLVAAVVIGLIAVGGGDYQIGRAHV